MPDARSERSRPLRWYRRLDAPTRAHVALRWASSPIGPLCSMLPVEGRILDWGCGHGLLALWKAHGSPAVTVLGCDIDAAKVALARAAAQETALGERVRFEQVEADASPTGRWDGVVINDVLYLLEPPAQEALVRACCRVLEPGGVILCAEMGDRPRWKARLAAVQEQIAVRIAGITASATGAATYPDPAEVAAWMADEGLAVDLVDQGRGYHVPHVAVRGVR
ncbi:class I SAM-dependent methyltransferase [Aquihabitans daechungensis]|uniref:class I SAM-dependent methyltransferase n=1 Tax=Aquihabitans daechungensis TaxID=1052257 RepID=UPI003B9EF54C